MQDENLKELCARVPREIIRDLLPLYVSGEASEQTGALVKLYLEQDSTLRSQANGEFAEDMAVAKGLRPEFSPELELRALSRTRALLRWQRMLYGWALALTVASVGGVGFVQDSHFSFRFFFQDYPQVFFPFATGALGLWVSYLILLWRLRSSR